jgi:hypothetical protein
VASAARPRGATLLVAGSLATLAALIGMVICVALVFGQGAGSCGAPAVGSVKGVPARLAPIYQEAAAHYRLGVRGPAILASINFHETAFGTNMGVSSAGAQGWMQFMPETWAAYGVDANGDGVKDPNDPEDAIWAAARYLRASGAPENWHDAIYSYNHAEWYVEMVFDDAERFAAGGVEEVETAGSVGCVSAPNDAVGEMVAEADRLSSRRPQSEYVYGGSHGISPTPANGPFDCSSAVSHLLQVAGFGNPTMTTVGLLSWGETGPGRWVTIHNKPYGSDAHTFLEFAADVTPPSKRYWGTSGIVAPGKGPGWISESSFSASYLDGFEKRHPPGL